MIKLKRAYEAAAARDGGRFLVERLWPRGVTRQAARLDGWLKELAPSPALRRWYGHAPERRPEFQRRYREELRAPDKQALLRQVAEKARKGTVTFVFAASDTERNSALLLKGIVERLMKGAGAGKAPARGKA